jgi:hypothetical protein
MRSLLPATGLALAALATIAFAPDGDIGIQNPSTIVPCEGKYYTYGAGGSLLVSDDLASRDRRGGCVPERYCRDGCEL